MTDGRQAECKVCQDARNVEYRKCNREQVSQTNKRRYLYQTYGLSQFQLDELYDEQGGKCAICESEISKDTLHIDHCHSSGIVRGLLCRSCNIGLGNFKDNKESLTKAIEYLEWEYGE